MRAIVGHLARAGVIQPAPSPPDRVPGRVIGGVGRPRARGLPHLGAARATRARWRQYRAVWACVEGTQLPPRGHPAPLRRPRARRRPRGPCCDVCDPVARARAAAGAPRARPAGRARGRAAAGDLELDDAILDVVAAAQPAVGRTRAVEILRGGRSKVIAQVLLRRPARLRHVRRTCAPTTVLGARRRAARRGHAALDAAGASRSSRHDVGAAGSASSPRARARTSRRCSTRVHGRDGIEVVAVGSDKPDAPALRARARRPGVDDARRSRRASSPTGPRATRAMADWLAEHGVELVVLAGYMQLLSPAFLARFPQRVINVHPALLPAFPGIARGRAGARLRGQGRSA